MPKRIHSIWLSLILITALQAGCHSGSSGGASGLVTVKGVSGGMPNATVVLGDRNGTMIASGTTDANGQIQFDNAPADATFTAAHSCMFSGSTTTLYFLDVQYDVNGPVTLNLIDCTGPFTPPSSTLGTVTVNVTNPLSNVTRNEISTNMPLFYGFPRLITQQTLTIEPYDLQDDGKLSIFVFGKDADGTSIAYGAVLDQTFTDGMTVNITVDQPVSFTSFEITNIPTTAYSLCPVIYMSRTGKGSTYIGDCHSLSSAPSSTTIDVPYIPGLGDQLAYGVLVSRDHNFGGDWSTASNQLLNTHGQPATSPVNQSFDFSQALSAPSLTVLAENTATPTLSWNNTDPGATDVHVSAGLLLSSISPIMSMQRIVINTDKLSTARTSITFPELPDSLAAFRPTGVEVFNVDIQANTDEIRKWSGGYCLSNRVYATGAPSSHKQSAHSLQLLRERAGIR